MLFVLTTGLLNGVVSITDLALCQVTLLVSVCEYTATGGRNIGRTGERRIGEDFCGQNKPVWFILRSW